MPASPFMREALAAARAVRGTTSPNPYVGAVLVRHGAVLATGATAPYGGPHAEAAAIAAVSDPRGAELYVTLEPCFPFEGKRTKPCSELIREAGIGRLVVALEDPDARVAGRGIAALRAAGISVEVGDGAEEARDLLRPYFKHRERGLPYVIAKFAASLDGRTATASGDSKWITGELARDLVHQQRAWVDAIMVGSGTVLADDPALTARPGGQLAAHQPVRVILDARGRTPLAARLLKEPGTTILATTYEAPPQWKGEMTSAGATVLECESAGPGVNLDQLLRTLAQRGVVSLWAEAGATLLGSLFDAGHVDEVWAFIAPIIIGGSGPGAVGGEGVARVAEAWRIDAPVVELVGHDMLVRGYTGEWTPGG